jgi:hypothetical protein
MTRLFLCGSLLFSIGLARPGLELGGGGAYIQALGSDVASYEPALGMGAVLGLRGILPGVGLEVSLGHCRFHRPDIDTTLIDEGKYELRYTPAVICGIYDSSPRLKGFPVQWFILAGLGLYCWEECYDGKAITLPPPLKGEISERDLGFVGGIGLEFFPLRCLGIRVVMSYHYITSTDLEKYGPWDKDERLWENGARLCLYF